MSAAIRAMSSKTVCRKAAPARSVKLSARRNVAVRAAAEVDQLTGVVFMPFTAVKAEMAVVDKADVAVASLARSGFHVECEAALNEQINIEYNISYVYHSLFAYFDRDNVGLKGFAKHFKAASNEEREHAELLMEFQNTRGGRVVLKSIMMPEMEFGHNEKGDALYASELALSLEKLNFQKLRELHDVADKNGDANMSDFIEGKLLEEQVNSVKAAAQVVSQLRRVGKGLGVWEFDKMLLNAA
jgi:ferritin heavy chain